MVPYEGCCGPCKDSPCACCFSNRVGVCDNCFRLCGPVSGRPKNYQPFNVQPVKKQRKEFVAVVMKQIRGNEAKSMSGRLGGAVMGGTAVQG